MNILLKRPKINNLVIRNKVIQFLACEGAIFKQTIDCKLQKPHWY